MKISAIMSSHNEGSFIRYALDALLHQSYPPCEIVVLDDDSTDDTREILTDYANAYPTVRSVLFSKLHDWLENKYRCCENLQGDWIDICSADNLLAPGFYEEAAIMIEQYPQAGYVFGENRVIDGECINAGRDPRPISLLRANTSFGHMCWKMPPQVGGAASLLRADMVQWLVEKRIWELGPWNDSVGFHVVGKIYGCIHIPMVFGLVRKFDRPDHGQRAAQECKPAVYRFLEELDVVEKCDPELLGRLRSKVESWEPNS